MPSDDPPVAAAGGSTIAAPWRAARRLHTVDASLSAGCEHHVAAAVATVLAGHLIVAEGAFAGPDARRRSRREGFGAAAAGA